MSGNAGAAKGLDDEGLVALGRAEEDGSVVEGNAGVEDAAGDLDAFEGFAGGGEKIERAVGGAGRDGVGGEEKALEGFEGGGGRVAGRGEAKVEGDAGPAEEAREKVLF